MFKSSISTEEIADLEPAAFHGEVVVVDAQDSVYDEAVSYLSMQKVIGFDTESRPCFSPHQPRYGTSLLQLSGGDKAFLFRLKLCGLDKRLRRILTSRRIIKVGAAVNDDIRGLQEYGEFKAEGFVDLQKIVGDYGIEDRSVKKMAAIILGVRISKTQQLSNWEADSLSESQLSYAATDAWICREMFFKLRAATGPTR